MVIDCNDPRAQEKWWSEALDWKLILETDNEYVIIPSWVDEATMRAIPREHIGPGIVFIQERKPKTIKNRLHIDLAPQAGNDHGAEVARLEKLGARRIDIGQPQDVSWTVLADPEGNEFCVLSSQTP
ncbi:MAG: VOC family protein [Actinopolymorphaceae bacterium]